MNETKETQSWTSREMLAGTRKVVELCAAPKMKYFASLRKSRLRRTREKNNEGQSIYEYESRIPVTVSSRVSPGTQNHCAVNAQLMRSAKDRRNRLDTFV